MQAKVIESGRDFWIELTAEDVAEAAVLVRLGLNGKKQVEHLWADAYKDGSIQATMTIPRRVRVTSTVSHQ